MPVPTKASASEDWWKQNKSIQKDYGGKDLWKRWVLSLEWKVEAVIDGESEDGDCDEVICAGWGEPGGEWTEWGWQRELIPQVRWCISKRTVGDL